MVFNYALRGEANMRLFETMACGAAPLLEEGNPEAALLLREGVHYLSYPRQGLRERLAALAAEPERLVEIAAAAKAEAPRHTKATQLRSAFDFAAGLGPAFDGTAARPGRPALASVGERAGIKAIATLRILGCNQSLEGAMWDYQEASGDFPELAYEAVLNNEASATVKAALAVKLLRKIESCANNCCSASDNLCQEVSKTALILR
jgi:hypothetical protein